MSSYIRFETNKAVVLALKSLQGEPAEGQYGNQVILPTMDDRTFYASEALLSKITDLGVHPGEPIQILKREVSKGTRKWIQWDVSRAESAPRPNSEVMRNLREQQHAAPAPAPQPAAAPLGSANLMAAAVMQAVEAAKAGEEHAKQLGMTFKFTEQHLSSFACTIYIQHAKLLGGNTAWQQ